MEIIENRIDHSLGSNKNKKQIILTHTSRNVLNFLQSLKYRLNGTYKKIPHYLVCRDGKVLKLLNDEECPKFFMDESLNKRSIIVSLENLGWLEKQPLKNYHINWIGDIYKEKVVEKKWRDYFFWQPYTEEQIDSLANLCKELLIKFEINKKCVGHNTKVKGVETYLGILTRSNFDEFSTDLSPAFNFECFLKKLENE